MTIIENMHADFPGCYFYATAWANEQAGAERIETMRTREPMYQKMNLQLLQNRGQTPHQHLSQTPNRSRDQTLLHRVLMIS